MTTQLQKRLARIRQREEDEQEAKRLQEEIAKAPIEGPRGPQGPEGPEGPRGDKPDHEWEGTKLKFEKPDGDWGEAVDLKGPRGRDGVGGAVVIQQGNGWFPQGWS